MTAMLPWQREPWERIMAARRLDRLPHGLLLLGGRGCGAGQFAQLLAQSLLCDDPDAEALPCGRCPSCLLFDAHTHPELMHVQPEEEGGAIKIDQVRQLVQFMDLKSSYGHGKIAIIEPADAMNRNASNSLLKTLEEPAGAAVFLLVSEHPARLPATIRSRCQTVELRHAPRDAARAWVQERAAAADVDLLLSLAGGAPLAAVELSEAEGLALRDQVLAGLESVTAGRDDPAAVAGRWKAAGASRALVWLALLVQDMLRLKYSPERRIIRNADLLERLQALAEPLNSQDLFRFHDAIGRHHASLQMHTSLRSEDVMEELLVNWLDCSGRRRP